MFGSIPASRGVNSTYSPASSIPSEGGQSPQSEMRRGNERPQVGWRNKGNAGNSDAGGGSKFNMNTPRVSGGGVIGPPMGGGRVRIGMDRL